MPNCRASLWRPLLPPPLAAQALEAAEEIARDLVPFARFEYDEPEEAFALSTGRAGVALFFAYLDRALPDRGYAGRALDLLNESIEALPERRFPADLYCGVAGIAWVLEHLRGWLLEEDEDPGEEVAAAVEALVRQSPWQRELDLVTGLVGLGVYGLERLPHPGGWECLRHVADRLGELAQRTGPGAAWFTPSKRLGAVSREIYPDGCFSLGVSHGVPGVIGWLAEATAAGLEVRGLLDAAVAWLLAQKLPPGSGSVFPAAVAPDVEPRKSRLAWCYGDPGVTVTLMNAALRTGNRAWLDEALAALQAAAARRDDPGVLDAGFCHGTAGLAHLFNRLYQASGDLYARDAALHWAGRTLERRCPGQGVGGFQAWETGAGRELDWRDKPGLQTGAAGIGLVLLAAATPVEPAWDRLFLASIPPKGLAGGETLL